MTVSDDLLSEPDRLSAVRELVSGLVDELDITAGFLVDEEGTPFATVGHIEFDLPHPLSQLEEGDVLLKALLGEETSTSGKDSDYAVQPVGERALLVLVTGRELSAREQRAARGTAQSIASLL